MHEGAEQETIAIAVGGACGVVVGPIAGRRAAVDGDSLLVKAERGSS